MSAKRTLVAGGTVATDYGVFPADVLIEDDHVVSLPDHGGLNGADEVIDATGLVVMPGAIDLRTPFIEEEAVHRALFLAAEARVCIQIVHVSSPVSAALVRRAKEDGQPASMEICPHHLLLDLDDLVRLGPYGRCAPDNPSPSANQTNS
jgi:dihydroorotase-like cyclic amidohydrolase